MPRSTSNRRPRRSLRYEPSIEALESRYAPATLVSPTTLTYQDADGDNVVVKFSKPLLTSQAVADAVFDFSLGSVNGSNVLKQQLRQIDLTSLGALAQGTTITVTGTFSPVNFGNGLANVGHINATGIDLGAVNVDGDLGQIDAGDAALTTTGLASLAVQSIGRFGTLTQVPGGDLNSSINGRFGALNVKSDINQALIETLGGAPATIGSVSVGGSVIGGVGNAGSVVAQGNIGPVVVNGDVSGGLSSQGNIASVVIGGSLLEGIVNAQGNLGNVTIKGNVIGGADNFSGLITGSNIGNVSIGSLLGGAGVFSGRIRANGTMGAVLVRGSIEGSDGADSGTIMSSFKLASLIVNGSLVGGSGSDSGQVQTLSGDMGPVTIKGNITGNDGDRSGGIESGGKLASLVVNGSLLGGVGLESGRVETAGDMGPVTVTGNIAGDDGKASGSIQSGGKLTSLVINGSLLGGFGDQSGRVLITSDAGPVTIRGSVIGGDNQGVAGQADDSGQILALGKMQSLFIGGSLVGGNANGVNGASQSGVVTIFKDAGLITIGGDVAGSDAFASGSFSIHSSAGITVGGSLLGTDAHLSARIMCSFGKLGFVKIGGNVQGGGGLQSARIVADNGSIGNVTIGGSITAGVGNAPSIDAREDIGAVLIKGSIVGTAADPVIISAAGDNANDGDDLGSIQSLTVLGRVEHAKILAGHREFGPKNADAKIGAVVVNGDWIASDLVAGVDDGADNKFGTADDALIADASNNPNVVSTIASITIKGQVVGTPFPNITDHYGFVAEKIGALSIGGAVVPLKAAIDDFFALGGFFDLSLLEV